MKTQNTDWLKTTKVFKPWDIAIIAALLLISLGVFMIFRNVGLFENGKAVIYADGVAIKELPLVENAVYSPDGYDIEFTVSDGGICVSEAGCKDKICMHRGYIYGSFEVIVCLPQKIAVRIADNTDSDIDVELN